MHKFSFLWIAGEAVGEDDLKQWMRTEMDTIKTDGIIHMRGPNGAVNH